MFDKEFFLKQMRDGVSIDDLASSIAEVLNEAEETYKAEEESKRKEAERIAAEKAKAEQVQKEKEEDAKEIAEYFSCFMQTYHPKCTSLHDWEAKDIISIAEGFAEMAGVFSELLDGHWPSFIMSSHNSGASANDKVNKFLKDFGLL